MHAQLLLSVMRLADAPNDRRSCSFQVLHCAKSFTVSAESPEMRRVWFRDIDEAIKACAGLKETTNQQLSVISRCHAASDRVMQLIQTSPAPAPTPAVAPLPKTPLPITPPFPPPTLLPKPPSTGPPLPPSSLELPPPIGVEVRGVMGSLEHVGELDLEDATIDALNAYADLLQMDPCPVDRATRAALDGLVLHLHEGEWDACEKQPPLTVSPEATAAWKANSGHNQTQAMKTFVRMLDTVKAQRSKATK